MRFVISQRNIFEDINKPLDFYDDWFNIQKNDIIKESKNL